MIDSPVKPIYILGINVFVDPFELANEKISKIRITEKAELEKKLAAEKDKAEKHQKRLDALERAKQRGVSMEELKILEKQEYEQNKPMGVGRYLNKNIKKSDNININIQVKKKPSNVVPARPVETVKKIDSDSASKEKVRFWRFLVLVK